MENFIKFIGIFVFSLLISFFNAWVLSKMWGWFVSQAFGFAVPKLYVLYGLMVTLVLFSNTNAVKDKEKEISTILIERFSTGVVVLILGWVTQAMFA